MENPMTALQDLNNYIRLRALTTPCTKARIVIMGSEFVGKTTIADWFVHKRKANELQSKKSQQHILMSPDLIMDLIDTDETALPALIRMNIRSADAFVLVYAVDDYYSFEYFRFMRDAIVKMRTADVPIVVVGNKMDIPERKVDPVVADCLVTIEWEHLYVEVSATNGDDELKAIFKELFPALKNESLGTGVFAPSQRTTSRRMSLSSLQNEVQKKKSALTLWVL